MDERSFAIPGSAPRGAVLVTGAAGFVGRYVLDALLARGTPAIGLVKPGDPAPRASAAHVEVDLRDAPAHERSE